MDLIKKLLVALLIISLVTVMLVACGGDTESDTQPDTGQSTPTATESQTQSETETPSITESQSNTDMETPVVTESQTESESEAPIVTESQTESQTETETKPELPELKVYDRTLGNLPTRLKCTGYCFDSIELNSSVYHQNSVGSSTESVKSMNINKGDIVALVGWIGFRLPISSFGYCIDGDVYEYVDLPDAKIEAESGVVDAGGEYRFRITVDTSVLTGSSHTLSFVAKMSRIRT